MPRLLCLPIVLLALAVSWPAAASPTGDDEKIIGTWERLHEKAKEKAKDEKDKDYIEESWTIKKTKDKWSVSGTFYQPGKGDVGYFKGKDVRFADGTLTFTQDFFKLPNGFKSGATVTASAEGDRLDVAFTPKKGAEVKDNLKRAGDGSELLGTWKGDGQTKGVKLAWTVEKDKTGALSIRGQVLRGDQVAGTWNGVNVRYFMKMLTFNQNFDKLPTKTWVNGTAYAAIGRENELIFIWFNGRVQSKHKLTLDSK